MYILTKLINFFKYNIPKRSNRLNFFFNTIKLLISLICIVAMLFLILSINASMLKLRFVLSIVFVGIPGILGAVIATRCAVSRLHDLNLSGWWLMAMILINIIFVILFKIYCISHIFTILLLLYPGTKGPNKFGEIQYADRLITTKFIVNQV